MSQESFKEEAARRNITAYQVKKERYNAKLIWLKNRLETLEHQNAILKDKNSQLFKYNTELVSENTLLKLEQFNTTRTLSQYDDIFNPSNMIEPQSDEFKPIWQEHIFIPDIINPVEPQGGASRQACDDSVLHTYNNNTQYNDSIPDILKDTQDVIQSDESEHNVSTHYDDSIPDILNNIQYSIPENFVRLAYS